MANYDDRVKSIEKIIKSGYVRHDEIVPALQKSGLSQIEPDDVSDLVKIHKYRATKLKIAKSGKSIVDKIGGYISAIVMAGVAAEIVAARKFADSLIGDKLQGFGENLKYWLGLKKIEISGPEMMVAMAKLVGATLDIVKGMIVGAAIGYVLWKVITRLIGYLLRRSRRRKDAGKLLERYGLTGEEMTNDPANAGL
jgi:hypothetical protein